MFINKQMLFLLGVLLAISPFVLQAAAHSYDDTPEFPLPLEELVASTSKVGSDSSSSTLENTALKLGLWALQDLEKDDRDTIDFLNTAFILEESPVLSDSEEDEDPGLVFALQVLEARDQDMIAAYRKQIESDRENVRKIIKQLEKNIAEAKNLQGLSDEQIKRIIQQSKVAKTLLRKVYAILKFSA